MGDARDEKDGLDEQTTRPRRRMALSLVEVPFKAPIWISWMPWTTTKSISNLLLASES